MLLHSYIDYELLENLHKNCHKVKIKRQYNELFFITQSLVSKSWKGKLAWLDIILPKIMIHVEHNRICCCALAIL